MIHTKIFTERFPYCRSNVTVIECISSNSKERYKEAENIQKCTKIIHNVHPNKFSEAGTLDSPAGSFVLLWGRGGGRKEAMMGNCIWLDRLCGQLGARQQQQQEHLACPFLRVRMAQEGLGGAW